MNAMGIIFTNDANIGELTAKRSIASIPFGGRYRQVDFGLTNLSWAGVHHVAMISRFNYQSLMDHIGDGEEWGLQYITPYSTSETHSYRGKLESLNNAMAFLEYSEEDEYVFLVDSAVRYMREHYQEKLTLQEVADRCYVSQWHLSKLLNKYMEMSFYDILNSIRIENAKRLLENPGLKIGQIGEMVGYADAAHFTRTFKKLEGINANEYRNRMRNS